MNRVYWVRHGENEANVTGALSCRRLDYPLNPRGLLQAQQTAEFFAGRRIDEIYCSPLRRAMQTAQIIGERLGLPVTVLQDLREMDLGDLEGGMPGSQSWAQFMAIVEAWSAGRHEVRFPGGEDYDALWRRMRGAFEEMVAQKEGHDILAVSHGGIVISTLKDLCPGVSADWARSHLTDNCSVTEFLVGRHRGHLQARIVSWASTAHLHGAAAPIPDHPADPRP